MAFFKSVDLWGYLKIYFQSWLKLILLLRQSLFALIYLAVVLGLSMLIPLLRLTPKMFRKRIPICTSDTLIQTWLFRSPYFVQNKLVLSFLRQPRKKIMDNVLDNIGKSLDWLISFYIKFGPLLYNAWISICIICIHF